MNFAYYTPSVILLKAMHEKIPVVHKYRFFTETTCKPSPALIDCPALQVPAETDISTPHSFHPSTLYPFPNQAVYCLSDRKLKIRQQLIIILALYGYKKHLSCVIHSPFHAMKCIYSTISKYAICIRAVHTFQIEGL